MVDERITHHIMVDERIKVENQIEFFLEIGETRIGHFIVINTHVSHSDTCHTCHKVTDRVMTQSDL